MNATANISVSGNQLTVTVHAFDMRNMYVAISLGITAAANGMHQFAGGSSAPSTPGRSVPVAILVAGNWHRAAASNRASPYPTGIPRRHAVWTAAYESVFRADPRSELGVVL